MIDDLFMKLSLYCVADFYSNFEVFYLSIVEYFDLTEDSFFYLKSESMFFDL